MQNDHSMVQLLKSLLPHITSRRRKQFVLVFLLMMFSTLAEVISIGSVMPFLAVLADPIMVFEHPAAQPIVKFLEITSPSCTAFKIFVDSRAIMPLSIRCRLRVT